MRAAQTARSPRREGFVRPSVYLFWYNWSVSWTVETLNETIEEESWRAENTPRHEIDLALSRAKLIKATEK